LTSPRNVVVQAGTKEFVGLVPATHLSVLPAIHAKTGIVEWTQADPTSELNFPYAEPIEAYSVGGGGGMYLKTRLIW
jgi:hypothetical protein